MRFKTLGKTGASVSVIGFGASPLGDVFGRVDASDGERAVHRAIDAGINFFDVAPYYGDTLAETRLGHALQGHRDKVIVATKCGRYGNNEFDFSAARVRRSIDESLRRLQTERLDLLQVHDIEFADVQQIIDETLPALYEARTAGKVRWVGITGYSLNMLRQVAEAQRVDTVLSYCRYNLLIDDMNELLVPVVRRQQLGLINASPLHMGILTELGAPAWHPAPVEVRKAGKRMVEYCRQRGLDASVVALNFCLQNPDVASTLVGMGSVEHVERNLQALTFGSEPAVREELLHLGGGSRGVVWPSGRAENADYVTESARGSE